jgi:hypothetical protein
MSAPIRQKQLNKLNPAAAHAKLGDVLNDLIVQVNALWVAVNAICVKLDADAGVTDTNYTSTIAPSAVTVKDLESRG